MMCACSNANVASAFGRNDPDEIGAAYFPLTELIADDLSTNQFAQKRAESLVEECFARTVCGHRTISGISAFLPATFACE